MMKVYLRSILVITCLGWCCEASTTTSGTSSTFRPNLSATPLSMRSGLPKVLRSKWERARKLAILEQAVEDYNAELVATAQNEVSAISSRLLIVLPLDEKFDPPPGVFSNGHVQTGDKMSLPSNFWASIQKSQAEVPWLFEISRIPSITTPATPGLPGVANLTRTVGGAIDFRSPPNYVFVPHWMMKALALRPLDVVGVRLVHDTPPGASVKLRPHTADFLKIKDHRAVLETELKHYSALTQESTIPFDYNGKRYYFDVIDLRSAPRMEKVPRAKVQDCDLVAEFTRSVEELEALRKKREEKLRRIAEGEDDDDDNSND